MVKMSSKLADIVPIYAKNPKLKKHEVKKVFEWLKTQPHLPELQELQVITFLHSCYYDIDKTKTTIENYFTMKTNFELFHSGSEEMLRRTFSTCILDVLPKTTPEGYIIWMFKFLDPSLEKFNCAEFIKVMTMALCLQFHQHGPSNGLIILCDVSGSSLGHLFKMNISAVRQNFQFLQEAVPTRIKGIHYINIVPITKHLIGLKRPFMKKEVYEVVRVHPYSVKTLYEYVPKECLPSDYGGELENLQILHERNVQNVIDNMDFFEWHDAQKVDESKRKKSRGFFNSLFSGNSN